MTAQPFGIHATGGGRVDPKVSIVVPTHFRVGMMSRLLEALKQLEYPQGCLELIVVGAEQDGSRLAVESFARMAPFPVAYYVVAEDVLRSVSHKRNIGAKVAQGEILAFLDDDCVPHSRWIAAAVTLFSNPVVGGVEGLIVAPKPDRPTRTYLGSLYLREPGGYRTGNMFYRRSTFEECGGFDESLPYLEDTDLGYTVIEHGYDIPFAAEAIVDHPVQPGNPLKLLIFARNARLIPYLVAKHPASRPRLRKTLRVFNRSHYPYLVLYGLVALVTPLNPGLGGSMLGGGAAVLVALHVTHDYWGLHFTVKEVLLTVVCEPIAPVIRLFSWLEGFLQVSLGYRRGDQPASR